ncbi:MAG: SPFH domain-containing protein [Lachnospiraceae bacterium]|nr:SPFH domain-containing protein [Lachnospiraceae bacterium]
MGLFEKNPNEVLYRGGKKHFAEVIKNTGDGAFLIWKQPEEDFNTNSTLIVMPGEMAIFVNGGNIEEVFENGTYKLSTQNYPFISRLRNAVTGGVSAFNCVVYFVKKADSEEILWGTATPIQARDKYWGIRTDIRARGSYKVHVDNPAMFLQKLIGSNRDFMTQKDLNSFFSNEFQSKIRSTISDAINKMDTELIGLDARLDELSQIVEPVMDGILQEYGLKCRNFNIAALDVDKSKYDNMDNAQMEANKRKMLTGSDRYAMDVLGSNWDKQQAVNIMTNLSNNENASAIGTLGAGMGMGMMAGSVFGGMAGQVRQPMQQPETQQDDPMETLAKLKKMLDAGLIEQDEYDAKKKEILSRI